MASWVTLQSLFGRSRDAYKMGVLLVPFGDKDSTYEAVRHWSIFPREPGGPSSAALAPATLV
jgi:hypothetical protein